MSYDTFFQTSYSPTHYVYIYVFNIFNKNKFFWIISMMIKIRLLIIIKVQKTDILLWNLYYLFTIFNDIYLSCFQCICGDEIKFVIFILWKAWRHLNIFLFLPLTFTKDAVIRMTYRILIIMCFQWDNNKQYFITWLSYSFVVKIGNHRITETYWHPLYIPHRMPTAYIYNVELNVDEMKTTTLV